MALGENVQILSRNDFGRLLNSLGLTGFAVEVGTHRGEFARLLLEKWQGQVLTCIDPWCNPPGYSDPIVDSKCDRELDYIAACNVLQHWIRNGRCSLVRMMSHSAAELFTVNQLDFVYIDADHHPDKVKQDIELWWPKVKPGGLLAGHDIFCPNEKIYNWGPGIKKVVTEFANANKRQLWTIPETGAPWSWYIQK